MHLQPLRHCTWLAAAATLAATAVAATAVPACTTPQRAFNEESRGGASGTSGERDGDDGGRATAGTRTAGTGNTSAFEPDAGGAPADATGGSPEQACDGCFIDGKCVSARAENPNNPCEICDPSRSRRAFTENDGGDCDDGSACTDDDRCDGSVCKGSERVCELSSTACNEATGKCECSGCAIGASCLASGAQNPANPCEVCTPTISTRAYSPTTGTSCGSTSECNAGVCVPLENPFDCIMPDPPVPTLPDDTFAGLQTTPPSPKGGPIAAGRYVPVRIDTYESLSASVDLRTFEFSKGFVQVATQPWNMDSEVAFIPAIRFAGSYTSANNQLSFTLARCDPQYNVDIPSLRYTASANGLQIIESLDDGGTRVTSYARQ